MALFVSCCLIRAALGLIVVAAAAISGCSESPSELPANPNIVLITIDTLRADRLRPYGYEKVNTPNIQTLAKEGILFENAFTDVSWTLASMSSVMTGRFPRHHGVRSWNDRLKEHHVTLAEHLLSLDYRTAAITGSYAVSQKFGLAQGFEEYDDSILTAPLADISGQEREPEARVVGRGGPGPRQPGREIDYRSDKEVADRAIHWLDKNADDRFFLWVHFFGPHEKVRRAGGKLATRTKYYQQQIALYDPAVEEMDAEVGRLLDRLRADPRYERTVVIFHSDHGQNLDAFTFGHGLDINEANVHIPMIVRLPGNRRAGDRVRHLVRNLDIYATVLGAASGAPVRDTDGHDLLLTDPPPDNHTYLETHLSLNLSVRKREVDGKSRKLGTVYRGIQTDRWKLMHKELRTSPRDKIGSPLSEKFIDEARIAILHDLSIDRRHRKNVIAENEKQVALLLEQLERYGDTRDEKPGQGDHLDDSAKERLRSLGYAPD